MGFLLFGFFGRMGGGGALVGFVFIFVFLFFILYPNNRPVFYKSSLHVL